MKSRSIAQLCACVVVSLLALPAFADGPLDPTFGDDYGVNPYPIGRHSAFALAITSDSQERLITTGYSTDASTTGFLTRHDPSGQLDISFDGNGIAVPFPDEYNDLTGVAVDHSGHIVVTGFIQGTTACGSDPSHDVYFYTVARFQNNGLTAGAPDTSFATTGHALAVVGDCNATGTPTGLAIDAHDSITVIGGATDDTGTTVIGLARWKSDGNLDTSFGTNGVVTTRTPYESAFGKAIAIDAAGKLWVAARGDTPVGVIAIILRYNTDGTLDTTFGASGLATISLAFNGEVCCIALDPDGRAVIAADADDDAGGPNRVLLARFDNNGRLDTSFGVGGIARPKISTGDSASVGLALDPQGRPYVAGWSDDFMLNSVTLVHYNLDGTLNTAAGFGGIFTTSLGDSSSYGAALLIDPLGRPTIAAYGYDRDGAFPALLRYDEMFGDGFD